MREHAELLAHVSLVLLCGGNHDELIHMEWMKKHQEISLPLPHISHHTIKGEVKWPAFYFRRLQGSTPLGHLCRCPSDLRCQLTSTRKSGLLWLPASCMLQVGLQRLYTCTPTHWSWEVSANLQNFAIKLPVFC